MTSFAPASGQQATTAPQTSTQQTTAQQTSILTTTASQQLIRQQAQRNPARRLGLGGQQPGIGAGLSVTLDYFSSLRYDDNLRLTDPSLGSTTWWENTLALGVVNQTQYSTLTFDLSGLYRIANEPIIGTESEFADPLARLTYQRSGYNSQLGALLEYRERDLSFNRSLTDVNLDGVIDAADVIGTIGDQVNTRGNLNFALGINNPLGFRFNYDRRELTYQNTINPNLFDNRYDDYSATALFNVSPVFQGNATISYRDFVAEDSVQTDRQTTTASVGGTYNVSAVTTINANVGYSQVDETQRANNTNNVTENFVWSFSWLRALPDGAVDLRLNQTFGVNGVRNNATVGRSFRRSYSSLNFNFGVSHGPFGETTPIGQLDYTYQWLNSRLGATIQRRVGTSTQSQETRQTLGFVTYDYFINPVSAVSFGVNFIDQESEGPVGSNPRQRATFDASYTRAITNDWAMTMGYQYEMDDQNGFEATSNSLYITLGRQFFLKP